VVLACGGFEANTEWRTRYLGPAGTCQGARHALQHRRGPAHGAGHRRGRAANWSGCHAVGWDRNAPEFGDLAVGDGFQKHSYPFG
jgi:tricarballylate dehydrogenase